MAKNDFNGMEQKDETLKDRLNEWKEFLSKGVKLLNIDKGSYTFTMGSEEEAELVRTLMLQELKGENESAEDQEQAAAASPKSKLKPEQADKIVTTSIVEVKDEKAEKDEKNVIVKKEYNVIVEVDSTLMSRVYDALIFATAAEIDTTKEHELVCKGKVVQMRLMSNRIELLHETDLEAAERMTDVNFAGLKKEIIPLEQVDHFEVSRYDVKDETGKKLKKLKNTVYIHGNSSQADRVWALRMDVDVLEELYEILNNHNMLQPDSVICNYTGSAREHADIPDAFIRQGEFGSQVFPPTPIAQKHKMPCQMYVGAWADHRYHLNGGLSVLPTTTEYYEKEAKELLEERDIEATQYAEEQTASITNPQKKAEEFDKAFKWYQEEHSGWFDEGVPTAQPDGICDTTGCGPLVGAMDEVRCLGKRTGIIGSFLACSTTTCRPDGGTSPSSMKKTATLNTRRFSRSAAPWRVWKSKTSLSSSITKIKRLTRKMLSARSTISNLCRGGSR
jgi:hypothetical protein